MITTLEKTKTNVKTFTEMLYEFRTKAEQIADFAAKAYSENPAFVDDVVELNSAIPPQLVYNLIAAGQRRMVASLVWEMDKPGVRKLVKLPYDVQLVHEKEPVKLVLENGDILLVDVRNLTSAQAVQVFNCDHMRSEAEQRAYIEDKKTKRAAPRINAVEGYEIKRGNLVIYQACTLTPRQLAEILAKMQS